MRKVIVSALMTSTMWVAACGSGSSSHPSTASAASNGPTSASSSTAMSSSPNERPSTKPSRPSQSSSASEGASGPASPASSSSASTAPLNESIRKFDFGNTTWKLTGVGTITLRNGVGTGPDGLGGQGHYATKADHDVPAPRAPIFGDLNGDGYEDAIVSLGWAGGVHGGEFPTVWLGGPGKPRQLDSHVIAGTGSCGDEVDSMTIRNHIIVETGKLFGSACAAPRTQPFTRSYVVRGMNVVQVSGPR